MSDNSAGPLEVRSSDGLGPLPEPWIAGGVMHAPREGTFTAAQMRAERERCYQLGIARAHTLKCPKCGVGDVSIGLTCHNSACAEYAIGRTLYEGWRGPNVISTPTHCPLRPSNNLERSGRIELGEWTPIRLTRG